MAMTKQSYRNDCIILRTSKRNLQRLYNNVKKYIDIDSEMVDSD